MGVMTDLVVRITGDIQGLKASMEESTRLTSRLVTDVEDGSRKIVSAFNSLAGAAGLTMGLAGATQLAKSFLDAASEAQGYETRLRVLLGSQAEANRLFEDMSKWAAKAPFELHDVMAAATSLAGVAKGGAAEVRAMMPLIGDLAAASGLSIQETTGQIIRMFSAGAGSADLFRERGILAMLGFQAGATYSAEETRKKVIGAWDDVHSKFRGATDEMAKDWAGKISNIKDAWFNLRREIAAEFITSPSATQWLEGIASGLTKITEFLVPRLKENVLSIQATMLDFVVVWNDINAGLSFFSKAEREQHEINARTAAQMSRELRAEIEATKFFEGIGRPAAGPSGPPANLNSFGAWGGKGGPGAAAATKSQRLEDPFGDVLANMFYAGGPSTESADWFNSFDKAWEDHFKELLPKAQAEGEAWALALGDGFNSLDWLKADDEAWKANFARMLPAAQAEGEAMAMALGDGFNDLDWRAVFDTSIGEAAKEESRKLDALFRSGQAQARLRRAETPGTREYDEVWRDQLRHANTFYASLTAREKLWASSHAKTWHEASAIVMHTQDMAIQGISNSVAQAIVYQQSLGKMIESLMKEIAASVISSLVQIAIQTIMSSMIEGSAKLAEGSVAMGVYAAETYAAAFASTVGYMGPAAAGYAESMVGMMMSGATTAKGTGMALFGGQADEGMVAPRRGTYLLNLMEGEELHPPTLQRKKNFLPSQKQTQHIHVYLGGKEIISEIIDATQRGASKGRVRIALERH